MSDSYTVTRHTYGITVEGAIPISEFGALAAVWSDLGWNQLYCAADIRARLGRPTMIVSNEQDMAAWRRELGLPEVTS